MFSHAVWDRELKASSEMGYQMAAIIWPSYSPHFMPIDLF